MADLSKIKVGDCIKFTARVASVTEGMVGITRPEAEDKSSQLYLGGRWIEAAEHIPAPRVFKRGDWVKLHFSDPQPERQKGIVLRGKQRTIESFGSRLEVEVSWPDGQIHWYVPNDLEPDEAPE